MQMPARKHNIIYMCRLIGIGGGVHTHKLLDYGVGADSLVAGERGDVWQTLIQLGQLISSLKVATGT